MGILKSLSVRNFKCFREELRIDFSQGTYIVGPNNAGKTAILQAVNCFFNSEAYTKDFLNRSEFSRRQTGFNRSDISLEFDLSLVSGRVRHDRMRVRYGNELNLTKSFTWREQSDIVLVTYKIGRESFEYEELDVDIKHLMGSVAISYIHPQEGKELLMRAQEKFKKRLFHNWGRHASVSERLSAVQGNWDDLRATANSYLSRALTDRIREIWPGSEIKINLPGKLEEIVAISDITFRSSLNLPEISLTSHGTGAQSTILYQTHFLLDSDRSLHQGMYFPIWLLEEPESFLHADIAFQLGRLLASTDWQSNIQMLISTHSPIILAGSHQDSLTKKWLVIDNAGVAQQLYVSEVGNEDISRIGKMMGDPNFDAYFLGASGEAIVLIEDSRNLTRQCFEAIGINVTQALGGISEVKKYLNVYMNVKEALGSKTYFIVDGDRGLQEISDILARGNIVGQYNDWRKYQLEVNLFVLVLPRGFSVEDIFDEWEGCLDEVVDDIFNNDMTLRPQIPVRLSRLVDPIRRNPPENRDQAKSIIRPMQDAKDQFWQRVRENDWTIADSHADALLELLEY